MKLITARTGQAHITPFLDSMWHRGMAGNESGVFDAFENFEAEIVSNNDINIKSGVGMIQGRFFVTEVGTFDAVTIDNGSQGLNRADLIVLRLTVNESADTQGAEYVVIKGESVEGSPTPPTPITGDLDMGALVADLPLYQINIEGLNIISVTPIYSNIRLPITAGGTGATTSEDALSNLGGISTKLLWQNASPASDFAAQTVSLDLSEYDAVEILSVYDNNGSVSDSVIVPIGDNGWLQCGNVYSSSPYYILGKRAFLVRNNGVTFEKNYQYQASYGEFNGRNIPYRIYGIKGVQ